MADPQCEEGETRDEAHIENATIPSTAINSICNIVGAGVLSLPMAYCNGSLSLAIFLTVLCGLGTYFTVYIVALASHHTGKGSYSEVAAFTLVPSKDDPTDEHKSRRKRAIARICVNFTIMCLNYGTIVAYTRIVADAFPPVVEDFLHGHGVVVERWFWLLIASAFFFLLTCARRMDELKWTSIMGVVTITYVVILVIVRYFTNLHTPISTVPIPKIINYDDITLKLFKTIGTLSLAYSYHFNVPAFYRELQHRTPRRFMTAVSVTIPIVMVMYLSNGIFGYLLFGQEVMHGGNIVDNFPNSDIAMNVGRIGLFFHFVAVYPILSVALRRATHDNILQVVKIIRHREAYDADEESVLVDNASIVSDEAALWKTPLPVIVCEAFVLVTLTTVVAAFVPGIGIVIEVIGIFFGLTLAFIIPGVEGVIMFRPKLNDRGEDENPHGSRPFFIGSSVALTVGIVCWILGGVSLAT